MVLQRTRYSFSKVCLLAINKKDMLRNGYGLWWSLLLEKGHGTDSVRNMLSLEDKPRTKLGHHKDIVKTTKNKKVKRGQAQDKQKTGKGLAKGLTNIKYNFFHSTCCHFSNLTTLKNTQSIFIKLFFHVKLIKAPIRILFVKIIGQL